MTSRKPFLLGLAILASGVGLGGFIFVQQSRGIADRLQQIVVPGEYDLALAPAGRHTIFHEQRAVVGDRYYASDRHLNGMKLRLQSLPALDDIAISPPKTRTSYSFADREGLSIATFEVPRAGTYRLSAWYPKPSTDTTAVLAIGEGIERRMMTALFASLAAALGGLVAATAIVGATFRRDRRTRRADAGESMTEEAHVRVKILVVVMAAAFADAGFGQPRRPTPAQGQPLVKPVVASVEARWSDVYCDLTELSKANPSELTVRFQYRNLRKAPFRLPNAELVPETRVLDAEGKTLYGVLKDAAGKPVASMMRDGAVSRPVAAGGTQAHWAKLEPPPDGAKAVTVLIDGCLPFESVTIGAAPATAPLAAPAASIAAQDGEGDGLGVEVTRLVRSAGGLLDVVVRYTNKGSAPFKFPNRGSAPTRRFASTYVLDSASRRKFEVARDKAGRPLSSESIELGPSAAGETLAPGAALNLWAKVPAPPDSVASVSLYVPLAPPFDNVPASGAGSGWAGGGSAVAGEVVGLDAALKKLNAKVTEAEIRIDLAADVLFDFDKSDVKKDAEPSLRNVATVLKANPGARVSIEGHTDGRGADDYNQKLSEARAASVKQWLVANGQVTGANLSTRGWGKTKPIAPNTKPNGADDPEGRAKNRRVEIVVRKAA